MKKVQYQRAELDVVMFNTMDAIVTSGDDPVETRPPVPVYIPDPKPPVY